MFEKCFEILNFGSNGTYLKFTVFVHFDVEFTAGKPKILLKTKTSASAKVMCAHENLGVSYEQFGSLLIPIILENSQI